jgi:hypothetical protein
MTPLLVAQLFLFPLVANTMASYWTDASRQIILQEVATQMGSTIQQICISVNRMEVSTGIIIYASTFPKEITSYPYIALGALTSSELNTSMTLILTLTLLEVGNTATAQASLGPNSLWDEDSIFQSSSEGASIRVQKFDDGTLLFWFD